MDKEFIAPSQLVGIQRRVYQLLASGGMYSAADIATRLHICDPRAHIRHLRDKGIYVSDEWRKCEHGRYKLYFIR